MGYFHYTDLNAIYSMLTNKNLRLTDIRYLNDSMELREGVTKLLDVIHQIQPNENSAQEYFDKAKSYLEQGLKDSIDGGVSEDPIFVFSLSNQADCLSQWRGYGMYAIEFDPEVLREEVGRIYKCEYDNASKVKLVMEKLNNAVSEVSLDMRQNYGCNNESIEVLSDLIAFSTTLKSTGFNEECEYRVIASSWLSGFSDNVKYRVRGDILIPYFEVPISLNCIKSITVGPIKNQSLAFNSLYEFVKKIERVHQLEIGNIEMR
ncbi:DUF2971 domain-containing protein [Vibrio parahaemolyticus]|uniref:DUF2971 domain-containing protein n=1 Tax=Vibrio parahaemolyticus TaxID=670 RepID=UPI0003F55416|nr:DUF2971 domain-containing protein [Vibrio parahaemolyticus]